MCAFRSSSTTLPILLRAWFFKRIVVAIARWMLEVFLCRLLYNRYQEMLKIALFVRLFCSTYKALDKVKGKPKKTKA